MAHVPAVWWAPSGWFLMQPLLLASYCILTWPLLCAEKEVSVVFLSLFPVCSTVIQLLCALQSDHSHGLVSINPIQLIPFAHFTHPPTPLFSGHHESQLCIYEFVFALFCFFFFICYVLFRFYIGVKSYGICLLPDLFHVV